MKVSYDDQVWEANICIPEMYFKRVQKSMPNMTVKLSNYGIDKYVKLKLLKPYSSWRNGLKTGSTRMAG